MHKTLSRKEEARCRRRSEIYGTLQRQPDCQLVSRPLTGSSKTPLSMRRKVVD